MSSICNGQSLLAVVHGHLPRKRQDGGWQGVSVQLDAHCVRLQQALLPVVAEGAVSKKHHPVAVAFAHEGEEQVATWPQQNQRGPAGHLQLMPETRLAIVYHRVGDVIAEDSAADVGEDLGRVGEKHRQHSYGLLINEICLELMDQLIHQGGSQNLIERKQ